MWSRSSGLPNPMTTGDSTTWPFYVALSLFRGAAILAGVRARALQGSGWSDAHEMGKLVDVFAKRALVVVKGESVPRGVSDLSGLDRSTVGPSSAVGFEPAPRRRRC